MSGSPFKTVVLPSILVATTVFSALTLSFVSRRSELATLKLQAAESEEAKPSDIYESKDFAIRYVGLTIILSVGSGVLTIEGLRRWNGLRESMQIKRQRSRLEKQLRSQEPQPEPATLVAVGQDVAVVEPLLEMGTHREVMPDQPFDGYSLTEQFDHAQANAEHYPLGFSSSDSPSEWADLSEFDPVAFYGDDLTQLASQAGAPTQQGLLTPQILESREQYQTCRIYVPHVQQHQFAILVEGQYYSFVRTATTRSAALKFATAITQRGQQSVITRTKSDYIVWAWEPEAFPELVA